MLTKTDGREFTIRFLSPLECGLNISIVIINFISRQIISLTMQSFKIVKRPLKE